MSMRGILPLALAWLLVPAAAPAANPNQPPPVIAVVDFEGYSKLGLDRKVPDLITDELVNTGRFSVVERERLATVMAEQGIQTLGTVASNPAQIANLVGADFLVTGSIVNAGRNVKTTQAYGVTTTSATSSVTVAARVIHAATGRILFSTKKTASAKALGSQYSSLDGPGYTSLARQRIARAISVNRNLREVPEAPAKAQLLLTITSDPAGADVEINGVYYGNAGGSFEVPEGMHTVKVSLPGYREWVKRIRVQRDMNFRARLAKLPEDGVKIQIQQSE